MPALVRHPAGALGAEAKDRGLVSFAREDAVSRREVFVELGFGGLAKVDRVVDVIDRKAPERAAQMIPGIEVPGVAVVSEALRRNGPLGDLFLAARVIGDAQTPALQGGAGGRLKMGARRSLRQAEGRMRRAVSPSPKRLCLTISPSRRESAAKCWLSNPGSKLSTVAGRRVGLAARDR